MDLSPTILNPAARSTAAARRSTRSNSCARCRVFEKSYIVDLPPQLGNPRNEARGRRLHALGRGTCSVCASFEDSIGVNGWPMESHVAGDVIFKFPADTPSRAVFNELPYSHAGP